MTEFAMVEELACLVKDNLPCKHLVLSMEEAFIKFLHNDTSSVGFMELEPMNPYNRLLLHRLADIFGFAHESVGEGDQRHLVLERCAETSVPSILVSDLLWQYDGPEPQIASDQILRRMDGSSQVLHSKTHERSLEEREAAYHAARERIFATDDNGSTETVRQKPRSDPMVARRMIVHALGQRVRTLNLDTPLEYRKSKKEHSTKSNSNETAESSIGEASSHDVLFKEPLNNKFSNGGILQKDKNSSISKERIKVENLVAAKRMFANALGLQTTKEGLHQKQRSSS